MKRLKSVSKWLAQFETDEGPRYLLDRTKRMGCRYVLHRQHSCSLYFVRLDELVARVKEANAPLVDEVKS